MKKFLVLALLLPGCVIRVDGSDWNIGGNSSSLEKVTRTDTAALTLKAGDRVILSSPYGDIQVRSSKAGKPEVEARITVGAKDEELAREILDALTLDQVAGEEGLAIKLDKGGKDWPRKNFFIMVDYRASLPPESKVRASTSSGDISIEGPFAAAEGKSSYGDVTASAIKGNTSAVSSSGKIKLSQVTGDTLVAKTSYGSVTLDRVEGKTIEAVSSSGKLNLTDLRAKSIEAKSSYGDLTLEGIEGDLTAKTSSGKVTVDLIGSGTHSIFSSYGSVRIRGGEGTLEAGSSSGNVYLEGFNGSVDVKSGYGSLELDGIFTTVRADTSSGKVRVKARRGSKAGTNWNLRSGYGSITLDIPESFACGIEAKSSYGAIQTDIPLLMESGTISGKSQIRGTLNGGGKTVTLRTSSGKIRIGKSD